MFVDCVSLEVSCMLFTSLFHHKGQEGVIPVVLTILGQIQKSVLKGDQDLLMAVVSKSKTIRPKLVKLGLQNKTYHCFNPAKVEDIRNRARKALAARWNQTNSSQLYEITHATSFGIDQLEAFQVCARHVLERDPFSACLPFILKFTLSTILSCPRRMPFAAYTRNESRVFPRRCSPTSSSPVLCI